MATGDCTLAAKAVCKPDICNSYRCHYTEVLFLCLYGGQRVISRQAQTTMGMGGRYPAFFFLNWHLPQPYTLDTLCVFFLLHMHFAFSLAHPFLLFAWRLPHHRKAPLKSTTLEFLLLLDGLRQANPRLNSVSLGKMEFQTSPFWSADCQHLIMVLRRSRRASLAAFSSSRHAGHNYMQFLFESHATSEQISIRSNGSFHVCTSGKHWAKVQ